jgi:hypothetical protein
MALNFTIVVHVRHQFGVVDQDIGVFAGLEQSFPFDCPSVSSDHALLLFQSLGVGHEQTLETNGVPVFGGVPVTDAVRGVTAGVPPEYGVPNHGSAPAVGGFIGLGGQRLDHQPGRAQEQRQCPAHRLKRRRVRHRQRSRRLQDPVTAQTSAGIT